MSDTSVRWKGLSPRSQVPSCSPEEQQLHPQPRRLLFVAIAHQTFLSALLKLRVPKLLSKLDPIAVFLGALIPVPSSTEAPVELQAASSYRVLRSKCVLLMISAGSVAPS